MLRALASVVATTLLVSGIVSCRGAEAPSSPSGSVIGAQGGAHGDKLTVVVSVAPQAYFVERLAGPWVDVQVLIPPGASHHTFEPGFEQIKAVSRADLFVNVGHPNFTFEAAWLSQLTESNRKLRVVNGSTGIPLLPGDPHTWTAPSSVTVMVRNIASVLIELLPQHRQEIEANLASFLRDIAAVDADLQKAVSGKQGHVFFVFHAAWGYLANAYGIQQVAIEQGASHPDAKTVARLIEQARSLGVKMILVQPQMEQTSAQTIAHEVGGTLEVVDPLAKDWLATMHRMADVLKVALSSRPL